MFCHAFIHHGIHIGGVIVSMLTSSAVNLGFEPRLDQTKDYDIGICCFSAKHAALRRKSKDWLAWNQDNVSEWANMSTCRLLFHWASIIEIQLPYLGLHNAQDFTQILYFIGGVHIINRNNVFHSFPDREITCPPYFFVYYCQHAKLNIS